MRLRHLPFYFDMAVGRVLLFTVKRLLSLSGRYERMASRRRIKHARKSEVLRIVVKHDG